MKLRKHRLNVARRAATSSPAPTALAAGDPILFGDAAVEATRDTTGSGVAEAFSFSNNAAGTTASISVYVGSNNGASKLYAGVYTDNNKHPGSLVVSGSLSNPKGGAWNNVPVSSAAVAAGRTYWVAVLGTGGTLRFRDRNPGPCASEISSQTRLGSLPASWKVGTQSAECPASAYVNGYLTVAPQNTVSAPSNTTLPAVSGSAMQGQTLSTDNGGWSGSPTGYSYQWRQCDATGNNCTNITNATGSTYTLASADVGKTIRSTVSATNAGATTAATSAATAAVTAIPPTAAFTLSPANPVTGQAVHFDASASSCYAAPCSYSWANTPAGATAWALGTSQTLDITFPQAMTEYVTLTVTDATGQTATIEHDVVVAAPAPPPPPSNTTLPQVSGTPTQGQTLSIDNGSWNGSPTGYSYQWRQCDSTGNNCTDLTGATNSTYIVAAGDVGKTIRSTVTAANDGGTTAATSAATATVAAIRPTAAFTFSPTNPVTGQAVHFDASASTCSAAPCTYSWADKPPTGGSWPLGTGQTVDFTFQQAATKYATLTITDATGQIATIEHDVVVSAAPPAAPSNTSLPQITGTTTQGQTLTTDNGTWSGSPTGYTYQWRQCDSAGTNCTTISAAASSTYTLASGDIGHTIRSVVTATNGGGTTSAISAQTGAVSAGGGGGASQTRNCFASPMACGLPDAAAPVGDPAHVGPNQSCASLPQVNGDVWASAGQTIENEQINGQLTVAVANVTVNNVCVNYNGAGAGGSVAVQVLNGASNTLIQNTKITAPGTGGSNSNDWGIKNWSGKVVTLNHDFLNHCGECIHDGPFAVNDSYVIVDGMQGTGEHFEDVYYNDDVASPGMSFSHDTLLNPEDQTSVIFSDNTIDSTCSVNEGIKNSLLAGGGNVIGWCGKSTSRGSATLDAEGNNIARCTTTPITKATDGGWDCSGSTGTGFASGSDSHGYWPFGGHYGTPQGVYCGQTGVVWSNNVWDDNGATLACTG